MNILNRLWTGIVAAVAGVAIAIVLQVAGQMAFAWPLDYLQRLLLACAGIGFLLGLVIGPRHSPAPTPRPPFTARDYLDEARAIKQALNEPPVPIELNPFPADAFIAFLREKFPSAQIHRTSNNRATIWIEVSRDEGHAEIVAYLDGTIGATDIARLDDKDIDPFAPFDKKLESVESAKEFMLRALSG